MSIKQKQKFMVYDLLKELKKQLIVIRSKVEVLERISNNLPGRFWVLRNDISNSLEYINSAINFIDDRIKEYESFLREVEVEV